MPVIARAALAGTIMKKPKKLELSFAMRVASEHLSYRSLIEEIEGDLEHARQAQAGAPRQLVQLLESFCAQVHAHFALEERGGLFEVYMEREPALQEQAAILVAQHRAFRASMTRILEAARALAQTQGPEFERFERELRALFQGLREHEQAEDALLDRLVDEDIRHGD